MYLLVPTHAPFEAKLNKQEYSVIERPSLVNRKSTCTHILHINNQITAISNFACANMSRVHTMEKAVRDKERPIVSRRPQEGLSTTAEASRTPREGGREDVNALDDRRGRGG